MERWPFITVASSPGEGLSQTPAGLGGIVETQKETESVCVLLQHVSVNVFSRWTHTGSRWLMSVLSLQPYTHTHAERGTRNKVVDQTSEELKPHNHNNVKLSLFIFFFNYLSDTKKMMDQN